MTAKQAAALLAQPAGAGKGRVRGTRRVTVQGIKFDSVRESKRWLVLRDREKRGEIVQLERQVVFVLQGRDGPILTPTGRPMTYRADFQYYDNTALRWCIEGAKGHQTDVSEMKLAILAAQGLVVDLV